jgi:DNA-binding transcriptional ArsR family regulator
MADNFDAIADSTRREILTILLERGGAGEITAADLAELLGVTTPTATKHLGVLRELGFVSSREEGRLKYFHLELTPFDELEAWLAPFVGSEYAPDEIESPATSDPLELHDDGAAVFAAWSGTDVGATIGRAIADRSYQARTAIQGASEKVAQALPDSVTRRWGNKA